jgi:hypothetical protein
MRGDEGHISFPCASPVELRLVRPSRRPHLLPRTARQGGSMGGRLSGAPCVLHRLVTTCGEPLPDVATGAKAPRRHASLSIAGASRRSSGGAARGWKAPRVPVDPDPLRGESGEAALGPGWLSGLRKRTGLRPSRAGVSAPRKRGAGAVSGLPASRKRAARGPHEPDALRVYVKRRVRAAGSSETSRPARGSRCVRDGVAQRRALQPVLPWFRDERCPSGSGWGEAPSSDPAFARGPSAMPSS